MPLEAPVFGKLTSHNILLIRADLEAAGIPYRDASDRVADFHSLRHSYISTLARSSASVKVVQTLARHSTPTLTFSVYAHVGLFDQAGALAALPDLGPTTTTAEPLAATGTEGPNRPQNPSLHFPYGGDGSGRNLTDSDGSGFPTIEGKRDREASLPTPQIQPFDGSCQLLSAPDMSGGGGIRTPGGPCGSSGFQDRRPKSAKGRGGNDLRPQTLRLAAQGKRASDKTAVDLAEVIAAWSRLSEDAQRRVVALIRAEIDP